MNRISALLMIALIVAAVTYPVQAQQPSPGASQPAENLPEVTYHLTVMMPQYRFVDTSGYSGRVGEYDSLQQSLGGDLSFNYVDIPQHMTIKSTWDILSRDDYDLKSRLTFGKWLDFTLDNRSLVRHLDDNSYFGAAVISPDIVRIDSIPAGFLTGYPAQDEQCCRQSAVAQDSGEVVCQRRLDWPGTGTARCSTSIWAAPATRPSTSRDARTATPLPNTAPTTTPHATSLEARRSS